MQIIWVIIDWAWFDAWRGPTFSVQQGQYVQVHSNSKNGQVSMFLAKVTNFAFMVLKEHNHGCYFSCFLVSSLLSI